MQNLPHVRRDLALLLLVSGAVFFFQLGSARLWDIDEAIFAETAREMFDRGDPITPYCNGELFTHKPPLLYWGMMLGFYCCGLTEFAARSGCALAGIGSVLVTYAVGRQLFSRSVGLWGGLILATCLQFSVIARAATPDAWLTFWTSLGMLLWIRGACAGQSAAGGNGARFQATGIGNATLVYAALGVGVLTKGPVALVLPVLAWAFFLVLRDSLTQHDSIAASYSAPPNRWRSRLEFLLRLLSPGRWLQAGWSMRPLLAIVVVLVVAGPWYALVGWRTDGEWLAGFFGVHNLGRFLNPMENHGGPPIYYLVALLPGLFPWSIFLTPLCLRAAHTLRARASGYEGDLALIAWATAWVGFFSFSGTKLPSYIAPAYPALALLTARFVAAWADEPAAVARFWWQAAFSVLGLVGIGTCIALPLVGERFLSGAYEYGLALIGLPLLFGAVAAWWVAARGNAGQALGVVTCCSAAFLCAALGWAAGRVGQFQNTPSLATRILAEAGDAPPAVITYGYWRPSLVFYTGAHTVELTNDQDVAKFFAEHSQAAFLVTPEAEYGRLRAVLPADVTALDSRRYFLKDGQLLLLGRNLQPATSVGANLDSIPPRR